MADNLFNLRAGYPLPIQPAAGWTATNVTCDAQNEGIAFGFYMPFSDTITHVGLRIGVNTGTVSDDVYTTGIQGITTGGLPDNTYLGGGTPASATFPNATYPEAGFTDGSGHKIALANSIALTGGTPYTMVIQATGTPDGSNNLSFTQRWAEGNRAGSTNCFTADSAGTWAKVAVQPLAFCLYSATRVYFLCVVTVTVEEAGTTSEKGFTFTLPSALGTGTFGVRAVRRYGVYAAGSTYCANLYSAPEGANPVIRQTVDQRDTDDVGNSASTGIDSVWPESSLYMVAPGTKLAVGFAGSAASAIDTTVLTLIDADCRTALPLGGLTYCARTLASAYPPDSSDGAFTESTTRVVLAELVFGEVVPPSGGSGGNANILRGSVIA